MNSPLLSVRDLRVSTTHRSLVHGVSFDIGPGERVGLIGESGSGKSLTSLSIMGLLPSMLSAHGSIRLSGTDHDLVGASDRQMRRVRGAAVGMVFQDPMTALNPTMRIGAQLIEALREHGRFPAKSLASQEALRLLDEMRLPDPRRAFHAYPHELSGGQRQRVVLAIALANRPSLLLCDEPTTALDVTVQAQMLGLIETMMDETGAGMLFVTHDLPVVATVCDRVIVMNGGSIVEAGALVDVFTNPQHPYTRGLLAASDLQSTDEAGRLHTVPSDLWEFRADAATCAYCSATEDTDPGGSRWIQTESGGYACWHEPNPVTHKREEVAA